MVKPGKFLIPQCNKMNENNKRAPSWWREVSTAGKTGQQLLILKFKIKWKFGGHIFGHIFGITLFSNKYFTVNIIHEIPQTNGYDSRCNSENMVKKSSQKYKFLTDLNSAEKT